jgi:hypothetical protein
MARDLVNLKHNHNPSRDLNTDRNDLYATNTLKADMFNAT